MNMSSLGQSIGKRAVGMGYAWVHLIRLVNVRLQYYLGNGQKATPATQLAYYTAVVDRIRQWDQRLYTRSTIMVNPGGKVMPGLLSLDIDWVMAFEVRLTGCA